MEYIFESIRLNFRRWKKEDRKIFAEMNSNSECMKYFPKVLDENESNSFIDRIEKHIETRGYGLWAVEEKDTTHFIGFIGFNYTELKTDFSPCIEIGWRLHPKSWGKGYATEGAKTCLQYAYSSLKLNEIYSFTSKINTKSEHIMQKIGMKRIGNFLHPNIDRTNPLCEHVLYKITKEEYITCRNIS
jgi:[ribosomal protein S5]-alanine N-acetyltransferase